MARSDADVWAEARRLVTEDGLEYADVASRLGLSISTISKRAAAEGWQGERAGRLAYLDKARSVKRQLLDAVANQLENQASNTDVANFARVWLEVERAVPEHRYGAAALDPRAKLGVALEAFDELRLYLEEGDRSLLGKLAPHLANPMLARRLSARFGAEAA